MVVDKKQFESFCDNFVIVGVDIIVLNGHDMLLLNRKIDPVIWWIPGGVLEKGESFADAARRELFEETGLKNLPLYGENRVFNVIFNNDTGMRHCVAVVFVAVSGIRDIVINEKEHSDYIWRNVKECIDDRFLHRLLRDEIRYAVYFTKRMGIW